MTMSRPRRPPLPCIHTDSSIASLFSRPVTPAPAPLIFVNGHASVTKQAVAECLALLMGDEKAVLFDARRLPKWDAGRSVDSDESGRRSSISTPISSPLPDNQMKMSLRRRRANTTVPSPCHGERCRRLFSHSSGLDDPNLDMNNEPGPSTPPSASSIDEEEAAPSTTPFLTALLSHPANSRRLAILPDYATDTPAGKATVRAYEKAAMQSGRVFLSVTVDSSSNGLYPGSACSSTTSSTASTPSVEYDQDASLRQRQDSCDRIDKERLPYLYRPYRCDDTANYPHMDLTNVTMAHAHEAALLVAEFVDRLVTARDSIDLTSAVSTPNECCEPRWHHP